MKCYIKKFKQIFLSKQFIKFIIIGIINTVNGVIFSYIYSKLLNEEIAFIFGYTSGLIISYLLNSFITFKERIEIRKFIKFIISSVPNFLIQYLSVLIILNILGMNKLIAYSLSAIIGVPVTYILMKYFTFRNKNRTQNFIEK
ncbi:GtrA family protein [Clostridium sp.]|uniref:GtrA family protein n=1 Tax=Clostridium sp. TaxID=1506 RepID=UPI0026145C70|nr:GtrA family protein [Clostridium sp.]